MIKSDMNMMSVSVDRTIYPINSTIYVRVRLEKSPKKDIIFSIFDSERKLLLSQILNTKTYDRLELKENNIFQVSFKMKGSMWKVGKTYIARATYESFYSEDSFIIDQRTPVIQSDKSVYNMGGDMIITVIDPDADKDSQVVEYIGNKEDSKLIIESKYGKIDGYKLMETEDSTAIFQGVIGILGIRKDGSVIPQKHNGEIIDRIQGTGIEDGYIGGTLGDEIKITYKNKTDTVNLLVYISNFGASIELDQKTYKPNDKVYLTIVAPDLNFDSAIINEIGQNSESLVRIRTSIDEINNFKLLETSTDAGIFVGELQLIKSKNNTRYDYKEKLKNKTITCTDNDFIEVIFTMFDDQEYVGRASIKVQ